MWWKPQMLFCLRKIFSSMANKLRKESHYLRVQKHFRILSMQTKDQWNLFRSHNSISIEYHHRDCMRAMKMDANVKIHFKTLPNSQNELVMQKNEYFLAMMLSRKRILYAILVVFVTTIYYSHIPNCHNKVILHHTGWQSPKSKMKYRNSN